MNYSDINAATAHHINGDLPLASRYYNKIFKRISGPPPWLLQQLYKAFEEVETPRGSFLHYNPRWNETIEEIVPSYNYRSRNRSNSCDHPIYTRSDLVCTCCCCHYRCPTHSSEYYL